MSNTRRILASRLLAIAPLAIALSAAGCSGGSSNNGGAGPNPGPLDTTTPTVTSTNPAADAPAAPRNTKVAATFSEAMEPSTISTSTFTLEQGVTPVAGAVVYAGTGTSAIFTPNVTLTATTTYTATIETGATDLAGNALAASFVWSFTTGATSDATAPSVTATSPTSNAVGVFLNGSVNATFDEAMDPSTITTATLRLTAPGSVVVSGSAAYNTPNRIATFRPGSNLLANSTYTATVTAGARDLAGNALASDFSWTFTTGAAGLQAQQGVVLGAAAGFAVLAGSTVTNVNNPGTLVTGDLGLSPGSAVTGFPPGDVNGTKHVNDTTAAQAKLDLTTAYNDAAGRTNAPISVSGNLGGMTLTPGLYKSTSGLLITGSDLTLDALGDANGVFIFQMDQTLQTTAGRQVVLSGGARAANIFWQVGSSATIGTTSAFQGTIMADQSISLATGATLEGRALARIGGVTLDTNAITVPTQ